MTKHYYQPTRAEEPRLTAATNRQRLEELKLARILNPAQAAVYDREIMRMEEWVAVSERRASC
jgi:hypothetical protein